MLKGTLDIQPPQIGICLQTYRVIVKISHFRFYWFEELDLGSKSCLKVLK